MKKFYLIWFGQLISSIGSGISAFALGIYVYEKTGSASNYSWVLLAAFLPALLLKPIGGTLSDRLDRRRMMIIGDLGSSLGVFIIIVALFKNTSALWPIYLGNMISSIFLALQNPAYKASITDLVEKERYSQASGLFQLAESAKYLISPLIAVVLMKFLNIKQLLILDSLSFMAAILTVLAAKVSPVTIELVKDQKNFVTDLQHGFIYLFNRKEILWLISIISFITFFIGLLQALLGPMILAFGSAKTLGLVQGIVTSGLLVGGVLMGLFGKTEKKIPVLSMGLFSCGVFFSLMGTSNNVVLITLFGFLFFLLLPLVNANLDVLVRSNVENDMQGRVWSIVSLISQLGMAIAFGVAGFLADKIFNPLLQENGLLASTIGAFIGTGEGRGIGLMFVISGILVAAIAVVINQLKPLRELE